MSKHTPRKRKYGPIKLLKKTKPRLFLPSVKAYSKRIRKELRDFSTNDWEYICKYVPLDENFIEQNKEKVYWHHISVYQRLSMQFIEKFHNVLNLGVITTHQIVDESFYIRHKNRVDWKHILRNKKISRQNLVLLVGHDFKDERTKQLFIEQLKQHA